MKKVLFSLLAVSAGLSLHAQRIAPGTQLPKPSATRGHSFVTGTNAPADLSKTTQVLTGPGDTLLLYDNQYDTLLFQSSALYSYGTVSPADSGYLFGTNAYGDNSFAEYFYPGFSGDTTIEIIGVISNWGGTVNPASTNSITFKLWNIDTNFYSLSTSTSFIGGLPGPTVLGSSQAVSLTSLNVTDPTTGTVTLFNNPVAGINSDFFLGYSITYSASAMNGDTIGLRSTPDGTGDGPGYYQVSGADTAYLSQNAVLTSSGQWLDGYIDLGKDVNLSLVPIFLIDPNTSVKGVTRNNLTVFGCAPNPAADQTNIRFSLQQSADVTIQVMDMAGRTMTTIQQPAQSIGDHAVTIQTGTWPAGNYVYEAHTSTGAVIASQLTIVR